MIRPEPTIRDKVAALPDERELDGFRGRLEFEGHMTPTIMNLIELRRAEIRGARK